MQDTFSTVKEFRNALSDVIKGNLPFVLLLGHEGVFALVTNSESNQIITPQVDELTPVIV